MEKKLNSRKVLLIFFSINLIPIYSLRIYINLTVRCIFKNSPIVQPFLPLTPELSNAVG